MCWGDGSELIKKPTDNREADLPLLHGEQKTLKECADECTKIAHCIAMEWKKDSKLCRLYKTCTTTDAAGWVVWRKVRTKARAASGLVGILSSPKRRFGAPRVWCVTIRDLRR